LTSGLAHNNPLLAQLMADVLGREVEVPQIQEPTAEPRSMVPSRHGWLPTMRKGARRFGAGKCVCYRAPPDSKADYDRLYNTGRFPTAKSSAPQCTSSKCSQVRVGRTKLQSERRICTWPSISNN
jgi:hypothetical protein